MVTVIIHSFIQQLLPELQLCASHYSSHWGLGCEQHRHVAYGLRARGTVTRRGKLVTWHRQEKKAGEERSCGGPGNRRKASRKERFSAGGRPSQSFASGWCGSHCEGQVAGGEGLRALPLGYNSSGAREKSQAFLFLFLLPSLFLRTLYFTQYINVHISNKCKHSRPPGVQASGQGQDR